MLEVGSGRGFDPRFACSAWGPEDEGPDNPDLDVARPPQGHIGSCMKLGSTLALPSIAWLCNVMINFHVSSVAEDIKETSCITERSACHGIGCAESFVFARITLCRSQLQAL